MAEKTEKKEYVCPICGASFRTKKGLDLHMKTKHPERVQNKDQTNKKKTKNVKKNQVKQANKKRTSTTKKVKKEKESEKLETKKKTSKKVKEKQSVKKKVAESAKERKEKREKKKSKKSKGIIITTIIVVIAIILGLAYYLYHPLNPSKVKKQALPSNVLAIVNDEYVTTNDIETFKKLLPPQLRPFISEQQILDQVIDRKLALQQAKSLGLSISNEELQQAYQQALMNSHVDRETFKKLLERINMSENEFLNYLKEQLLINKLINETILKNIEVTDQELKQYYENNKEKLEWVQVKHLLVCYQGATGCKNNRTKEQAYNLIKEIKENITPENFGEYVSKYSDDIATKYNSGLLPKFTRGMMVPEFETVAFSLQPGEISDIVETNYGYHIIYMINRSGSSFDDLKDQIKQIILSEKAAQSTELYLKQLREKANIKIIAKEYNNETQSQEENEENLMKEKESTDTGDLKAETNKIAESSEHAKKNLNEIGLCFKQHGIENAVIFFHADWCPHCQRMLPIAKKLSEEGYKIYYANTNNQEAMLALRDCYGNKANDGVPQFICSNDGKRILGETTENNLRDFIKTCTA